MRSSGSTLGPKRMMRPFLASSGIQRFISMEYTVSSLYRVKLGVSTNLSLGRHRESGLRVTGTVSSAILNPKSELDLLSCPGYGSWSGYKCPSTVVRRLREWRPKRTRNRNIDVFLQFIKNSLPDSHPFTLKSDSVTNHGHSQDTAAQDPQSLMTNTL